MRLEEHGIYLSHERIYQHIWTDKRNGGDLQRIGDWEIDTVIGKNHKSALVTIVERKSKFTLIKKVDSKHADVVSDATIELLKPHGDKTLTITADNGKEFAGHETMAEALDAEVYFAHLYCSWERGLNENTNGLIRQYFPKGAVLKTLRTSRLSSSCTALTIALERG